MSTENKGLVAGNAQNVAGGNVPRSRSRFPLSDSFFTTERFADYNPCFVMEGVSGDKITLNQPHLVRTYSLKAPLLQNILKKKDYFMVPMQAILPLNWEKFYTNPTIGDDVPDGVGCGVPNFWGRLLSIFRTDKVSLTTTLSGSGTAATKLHDLLLFLLFYEMFYSKGCLIKQLRISGDAYVEILDNNNGVKDFDWLFNQCIDLLFGQGGIKSFGLTIGGNSYTVLVNATSESIGAITLREAFELMRDDLSFTIGGVTQETSPQWDGNIASFLGTVTLTANYVPSAPTDGTADFHTDGIPLNLSRLWAYQICVAHYYSNDHVDVIYSAELYRQYIANIIYTAFSTTGVGNTSFTFTYNGMKYHYDALSACNLNRLACDGVNSISFTSAFKTVFSRGNSSLAYFVSLFGFKKSLRFLDYFTGSRTRPLAIGDASVDTSGSSVGVLDISKKIQATRFYNAVNRSGRKFSSYMKEFFGITPKPDYHNPFYLAHTSDVVGGSEVENTGAAQFTQANSVTTTLRSNASRYAFSFEPDRDCIIIGISYYDLPRVYTKLTERQNFYLDRMDMFNPMMQYIGDQQIYKAELGTYQPSLSAFSYTTRDMEYKQRSNYGAGGFCAYGTNLDLWFFAADTLRRKYQTQLGSSYIRSFNSEFDKFYLSLTGWSLGTYFHFIVRYDDRCDASRPMSYAPGILQ